MLGASGCILCAILCTYTYGIIASILELVMTVLNRTWHWISALRCEGFLTLQLQQRTFYRLLKGKNVVNVLQFAFQPYA